MNSLTYATVVVIFEPPADPAMKTTSPFSFKTITGHMDESGRLPGLMKLAGEGSRPNPFFFPGDAKSSIWSFNMMPVLLERIILPKLQNLKSIFP